MNLRLLEGEMLIHKGFVYIVKGYQHPEGYAVAYPRYNLLLRCKLEPHEARVLVRPAYWDCIKQHVPMVPITGSYGYRSTCTSSIVCEVKSTLEALLDVELYLTGSASVLENYNDVDFVIYGATEDVVAKARKLVETGVLKKNESMLVNEYARKHSSSMSLADYLYLKRSTILHFMLLGVHVNLKLVQYKYGYTECTDPVLDFKLVTGKIRVLKPINPHTIPARYEALLNNRSVVLESLREVYSELEPGDYYIQNARMEVRRSGLYVVPDSGVLLPLR
ncbi:MAG: hypothetical protein QXE28_01955 [Desulfurococcaceae archaeon]